MWNYVLHFLLRGWVRRLLHFTSACPDWWMPRICSATGLMGDSERLKQPLAVPWCINERTCMFNTQNVMETRLANLLIRGHWIWKWHWNLQLGSSFHGVITWSAILAAHVFITWTVKLSPVSYEVLYESVPKCFHENCVVTVSPGILLLWTGRKNVPEVCK